MASEMECTPAQLGAKIVNGQADLESLKSTILKSIDSKLSQNEETMWRKGLKEIKRLQSDQQEVLSVVGDLQDKQEALATENQQLRSALCEVTAKFEQVVNEMRSALRQLPQRGNHHGQVSPSPSLASTAASDAATPGLGGLLHATELAQGRVHVGHLERALQRYGPLPESFEEAWARLVGITEKARLVNELNTLIESRLKVSSKVDDSRDECRECATLLLQYEDALRKLQKATLFVLDNQPAQRAMPMQDESYTEPTPSSKGNLSMTTPGFTPTWPALAEDPGETFSTPPRGAMSSEDPALLADTRWPPRHPYDPSPGFPTMTNASASSAPMASSPAAVLSLASALASEPSPAVGGGSPLSNGAASGGLKQLQLAECLAESPAPAPTPATPTPTPLKVELHKAPGFTTLGMEVNEENGTVIRVQSIDEHGLVGRHNRACVGHGASKIHVNDLIIEINGISSDPAAMLQECKNQQVLILIIIRGSSTTSPMPSTVPPPPGGNASADELERVLAEVTSMQQFKEISAPPASWGRLRPEAREFVPSSTQASDSTPLTESLDSDSRLAQAQPSNDMAESSPPGLPTTGATEGCTTTGAPNGSEDGLARLLFSP